MATVDKNLHVLLVEDNDDHAALITRGLERSEGGHIDLTRVDRLSAGLCELAHHDFDAVLLDLNLPDSDGLTTCYRICDSAPHTPVIVMTSLNIAAEGVRLVRERAEDYLPKGKLDGELVLRAILCAVERSGRREAEFALHHAQGGLAAARRIQTELLPKTPPHLAGLDIAATSEPAETVAGDYYDFLTTRTGRLGIALGDVAGHGPAAAMLMAVATGAIRTAFDAGGDLATVLSQVNSVFLNHPPKRGFMTLLLVEWNPARRSIVYTAAGHPFGYVFDSRGALRWRMDTFNGVPLGVENDYPYRLSDPFELLPGEFLLMVSDGVLEAGAPRLFDEQRLLETVARHYQASAAGLVEAVCRAVQRHCGDRSPNDDVTVVVMRLVD